MHHAYRVLVAIIVGVGTLLAAPGAHAQCAT